MNYLLLIYEDEKALHDRDEKTRNQVFQEYGAFTASVRDGGRTQSCRRGLDGVRRGRRAPLARSVGR